MEGISCQSQKLHSQILQTEQDQDEESESSGLQRPKGERSVYLSVKVKVNLFVIKQLTKLSYMLY